MKEIILAVWAGVGTAFMALAALNAYQKNKSEKTERNGPLRNRQRRVRTGNLPLERQDQVEKLEKRFFLGIDNKLELRPDQIEQLKRYLQNSLNENREVFENARTVEEILKLMKSTKIINSQSYGRISAILKEAGLDAEPIAWQIGRLTDAVRDIRDGNEPIHDFEADIFEYDAVIIHCEDDREGVVGFMKNITETLNVPNLSLCTLDEFNITGPRLQALSSVFLRARYVFVYVTHNLSNEDYVRFMAEIALTASLQDPQKKSRIIPIWTTKERVSISELEPFPGFKYWSYFNEKEKQRFLDNFANFFFEGRRSIVQMA